MTLLGSRGGLGDGGSLEGELAVAGVGQDRVALAEAALEERRRERVLDQALQRTLQRTRTVRRIPTCLRQQLLRRRRQLDVDPPLRQPSPQSRELELDDLRELLARELLEDDDLVDPVQELRPEALPGLLGRADVRGHDQHRVAEVDRAAVAVRQTA